jgi:drug/metabolite transporter (DMT)-like permease
VVAVFSAIILKKKCDKRLFISLGICYIGVLLTIYSEIVFGNINNHAILGILLVFTSVISYATFYITSEKAVRTMDSNIFNTLSMVITCCLTLLFNLNFEHQNLLGFSLNVYLLSLAMAIFSTVLPSFFIMKSISLLGATTVSVFNNLGPFITLLAGFLCLGEKITSFQILGTITIIIGILYLKNRKS